MLIWLIGLAVYLIITGCLALNDLNQYKPMGWVPWWPIYAGKRMGRSLKHIPRWFYRYIVVEFMRAIKS